MYASTGTDRLWSNILVPSTEAWLRIMQIFVVESITIYTNTSPPAAFVRAQHITAPAAAMAQQTTTQSGRIFIFEFEFIGDDQECRLGLHISTFIKINLRFNYRSRCKFMLYVGYGYLQILYLRRL